MKQANSSLSSILILKVSKLVVCMLSVLMVVGCSNEESNIENKPVGKKNEVTKVEETKENFKINEDEIMTTIKDITTEKKAYGTEEEKRVATYLKNKMDGYGYNVEFQDFEVYEQERHLLFNDNLEDFFNLNPINSELKGVARNVIVKSKSYDKNKKTLYLTAHYDTTTNTTGVYDNATGVSSIIEIARVLKNYNNNDFNIAFILFSAEEYHRSGSRYFVSQLSDKDRENILGAINIDMIGYTGFKYKDLPEVGNPSIHLCPWVKKDALETLFNEQFNNKYRVDDQGGGVSDDISFARIGVPTLYFADEDSLSGFEIEKEDTKTQLDPVNSKVISNLSEDIVAFLKNFNIEKFNELNSISDEKKGTFETREKIS